MPIDETFGGFRGHTLPPHVSVGCGGNVGEDGVGGEHVHGNGVCCRAGSWSNTEEARFRVDGAQAAIPSRCEPGDVIADGFNLPPGEAWLHHGEISFATGTGEGRNHVVGLTLGARNFDEQHVLGHPAFFFGQNRRDAKGERFLRQESVSTIGRSKRPDFFRLGEVRNVFGLVAGPGSIVVAVGEGCSHGVEALDPGCAVRNFVEHLVADPHHHVKTQNDVGRICDLHPEAGHRGVQGAHREGNDIEGSTAHCPVTEFAQGGAHGGRVFPVVGGTGIEGVRGANESSRFDPGNIGGLAPREVAPWSHIVVEFRQGALVHHEVDEVLGFAL